MDFNPQSGHEQMGRRPALVISNNILNHHSAMVMVCPITNTDKQHPFHIPLDERTDTTGVVLVEQAKMLDVTARNAVFKEEAPKDIWEEARDLAIQFLE